MSILLKLSGKKVNKDIKLHKKALLAQPASLETKLCINKSTAGGCRSSSVMATIKVLHTDNNANRDDRVTTIKLGQNIKQNSLQNTGI